MHSLTPHELAKVKLSTCLRLNGTKSMSWRDAPSDDAVFCQMFRRDDDGAPLGIIRYEIIIPLALSCLALVTAQCPRAKGMGSVPLGCKRDRGALTNG
jgi:hypothetical protein